jgi:hypothetical protein
MKQNMKNKNKKSAREKQKIRSPFFGLSLFNLQRHFCLLNVTCFASPSHLAHIFIFLPQRSHRGLRPQPKKMEPQISQISQIKKNFQNN